MPRVRRSPPIQIHDTMRFTWSLTVAWVPVAGEVTEDEVDVLEAAEPVVDVGDRGLLLRIELARGQEHVERRSRAGAARITVKSPVTLKWFDSSVASSPSKRTR